MYTVEPVYYGHLGTNQRCPDYQGVLIIQVSLYDKAPFGTIARCPDYAGVTFSSVLINRFHCTLLCNLKHLTIYYLGSYIRTLNIYTDKLLKLNYHYTLLEP